MPGKLIPGEKKTPVYKKSSGFKMKSSPAKIYQLSSMNGKKAKRSNSLSNYTRNII